GRLLKMGMRVRSELGQYRVCFGLAEHLGSAIARRLQSDDRTAMADGFARFLGGCQRGSFNAAQVIHGHLDGFPANGHAEFRHGWYSWVWDGAARSIRLRWRSASRLLSQRSISCSS